MCIIKRVIIRKKDAEEDNIIDDFTEVLMN